MLYKEKREAKRIAMLNACLTEHTKDNKTFPGVRKRLIPIIF